MDSKREVLNNLLVVMFNQILNIEEHALKKGVFNNLTLSELHVLDAIGYDATKPMSAIAAKLDITVGTLTIAMNNLVKKGYVTRVRGEEDRRMVLICLTELGRDAFKHHEAFHEEMINFTMSTLNAQESDVLLKALSKMTDYFNEKYQK